jgi:uncharacterized protein DUF1905/bacteriocin resistance YdeI/OmpD-like protein
MTKHKFQAIILKEGINPYVDVPADITAAMEKTKGFIYIKGKINKHSFTQTLVPVKNKPYRLFVNGPMLKGSNTKPGDRVNFVIEQTLHPETIEMPKELKKELSKNGLLKSFNQLTPSRQKEIFRYLHNLKTKESLEKNIQKVIGQLSGKTHTGKSYLRNIRPVSGS